MIMSENFSPKRGNTLHVRTSGIRKLQYMKKKSTIKSTDQGREIMSTLMNSPTTSSSFNNSKTNDDTEAQRKQPNRMYEFSCSGLIDRDDSCLNGRTVEWKASFELPLEEFVYPSLQRYEYDDASSPQVKSMFTLRLHSNSSSS